MTRKENKSELIVVGLDIGITSVGWAVIDAANDKLIDSGVRHFEEATEASEARKHRSARRNLRHKKWCKTQLKKAFVDFGIISEQDMSKDNFAAYDAVGNGLERPKDKTVYHLRKRALSEEVTPRELFLCLYNIAQARGHFLMQDVDFEKDAISFKTYKERFYALSENYINYSDNRSEFEDKVLSEIFEGRLDSNSIKTTIKNLNRDICSDEDDEEKLINLVKLIRGYKVKLDSIDESLVILKEDGEPKTESVNINDLKKLEDQVNNVQQDLINLFDMAKIYRVLKDHDYICEIAIEKLEAYEKGCIKNEKGEYVSVSDLLKEKEEKKDKTPLRSVKNVENTYPNGLYLKEARAILRKQKEFHSNLISDLFIEVCISNLSSRIPYYIGPLSKNAKNAWIDRKDDKKFAYSYDYTQDKIGIVDEFESIRKWKERMVSHCTYLPEHTAMPKGSFVGETFSIVGEMNLYLVIDANGNERHLTYEEKRNVFNELFLNPKSNKVKFSEVSNLLGLSYYGPRDVTSMKAFNNAYTIYFKITEILPDLKIDDIEEIFSADAKIEKLEKIILDLNLFDEEESKVKYFMDPDYGYQYTEEVAKKLSKINSKGYYSLSKEFVMNFKIDGYNSLLDRLFNTEYEQSYLITHACDKNGEILDLNANKYEAILKDNPKLSIDLLIEGDKPVIPVSRPVIRGLNETLKVYSQIIEYYGVPDRLVIETARELTDKTKSKKKPVSRKKRIQNVYDSLIKQKKFSGMIESDWEKVESFLKENSDKIELYLRQGGRDMISGQKIDLDHLNEYEIDHILPVGFGDDSMDNKELIHRNVNSYKKDRLPLEFIESGDRIKHGIKTTAKQFIDRVKELHDIKIGDEPLISEKKCKMLLMRDSSDVEGFIDQNIVDTRYVIKEFMSIIRAYNKVKGYKTHVSSLKSAYTKLYREGLGIIKDRDTGLQHHAIDATIIAIADTCLEKMFPHYDERKVQSEFYSRFKSLMEDTKNYGSDTGKESKNELRRMIKTAYYKAFGVDNTHSKLLSKMKSETPLYSEKVLKNYRGEYFEATLHSPYDKEGSEEQVLSILGINNKKRAFSGINCAAVDFYKLPEDKKGRREHVAIQIPKAIIDKDGNIDKDKYIKLIKEHYKKPELLDDDDNINEKLFRFRAYKNDVIYDTYTKEPQSFILGSIALKKLELKTINIFSYNKIIEVAKQVKRELIRDFDFKAPENKEGTNSFADINNRNDVIDYIIEKYFGQEKDKYEKAIRSDEVLKKQTNIGAFARRVATLVAWIEKTNLPPSIQGRYLPVADNNAIKKDPDAEYVKLKYNVLGFRFSKNKDGALIITGPKGHENAFKRIKREKFYWQLKKDVI